ncbi:protein kinase domain-containing protein [Pendulispora albinea]|uniref:Protein kinase n=1 Tax=Pendulispora albinea TaxID=2741071 RepID=A0ABZ2LS10_9BACT
MQRDPFRFNGTVIDGQFRIDQWIGEGGFSNVYKGFHLGLNEPIAVKCLKPIADAPDVVQDFVNRFRDESRIAYRLSQGNLDIVRCVASGTTIAPIGVRIPYMVLEWLEGESLAVHFRGRAQAKMKGRSLKETFELFTPAGEALVYAHSHGIVHRDIKPGNLFLTRTRQGTTRLKVLDFGMAKVLGDGSSSESTGFSRLAMSMGNIAIFSPPYAAPEQFDPTLGPIGPRVDVYSFALVFLEALLDRRVRTGETDAECLIQACKPAVPITPRGLGLQLPDAVERILTQACATNPRERPQSMEEFWGKLRNAMQGNVRDPKNDKDDPQDWGDVADSIPPDADGPATIVADSEGLFDDEPPGPPLPPIPGPGTNRLPNVQVASNDEEATRTIDVNSLPSLPGQPPQQPIPPEVKDFLQRTGLAASARMPSPSTPQAGGGLPQTGAGAKPFARPSQPGAFHLPRPTIPRPEGGPASSGAPRIPAPLPAAGTPAEGVPARTEGANGRAGAGNPPRPGGTLAMPIQVPNANNDDNGPSSSELPTTVGSLSEHISGPAAIPSGGPAAGKPAGGPPAFGSGQQGARFDLASAETQFAPDGPAPSPFTGPPGQQPFYPPSFSTGSGPGASAKGSQPGAGAGANKTVALSSAAFAQFSATPPADPDAEAPTQAQFAPQLQDAMAYNPPPAYPPAYPPQQQGSPFGGAEAAAQQVASPFGSYGNAPGASSPFGGSGGGGGPYGPPPGLGGTSAMPQMNMPGAAPPQQAPGGSWPQPQGLPPQQPGAQGFQPPQAFPQQPPPGAAPYGAQPQKPKLILIGLIAALAVILLIGAGYAAYTLLHGSGTEAGTTEPPATPSAGTEATNPPAQPSATVQPPPPETVPPPPPPPPPAPTVEKTVEPPPSAATPAAPADPPRRPPTSDRPTGAPPGDRSPTPDKPPAPKPNSAPGTDTGPTQVQRPAPGAATEPGKFDPAAARAALKKQESVLASCKRPDGPTGPGKVRVTFLGDGSVMNSVVVGPPYEGTTVGDCVATRFKYTRGPKFDGNPGMIDYSFNINK